MEKMSSIMDIKKTQNIKKPEPVAGIASLKPYQQGQSKIDNRTNPIKLSSNESNLGASPKAIKAYKDYANQLFRYPEGSQRELIEAIGDRFKLNPQQIVCGNGSDELILLLIRAYTQPNDEIIISEHSFVMAKIHARTHGASIIIAPEPELKISVDEILARLTPRTKMIIVANPNNPIGQYIPAHEIRRLHENIPPPGVICG
ncbi:MAG: aminotransferase class I/II-fold pyridoxal phosphate-dependent enzyme [Alphaproteobacteria bacterium]|nr:aminotransferase class I/II-fold pyridoxal phosphate-dependent enzyme [Alphaproteobacteria bacterium]